MFKKCVFTFVTYRWEFTLSETNGPNDYSCTHSTPHTNHNIISLIECNSVTMQKNCSFWANTAFKLSFVVVILFSLIVVLAPNVQFLGCVTVAISERCNDNFWIHMWNLEFWEDAFPLSESNFRCWSERLWCLFLHHKHHGLNILSCVIHRPFRWGLGSQTGYSMRNFWWTKQHSDRVFSQCSVFPCHPSTSAACSLIHHHRRFVILAMNVVEYNTWKNVVKNNKYVWHRRSFKGQCNIDGYYVEATSVLFIVSIKTCYWKSKHWNLLRVIQVIENETWFQSVTDMTK